VKPLAVKVVDLSSRISQISAKVKAPLDELDIMAELQHPNIVRLIQVFKNSSFLYIVMERMEDAQAILKVGEDQKVNNVDVTVRPFKARGSDLENIGASNVDDALAGA